MENNNLTQPVQPVQQPVQPVQQHVYQQPVQSVQPMQQPVYQQPVQPVQPMQQPVYQQPVQPVQPIYQQPVQPIMNQDVGSDYAAKSHTFLSSSIADVACSWLPIGSIICMIKAKKNRKNLLEYVKQGNQLTGKLKTASILFRVAFGVGLGFTIFYGIYAFYFVIAVTEMIKASM